MRAVSQYQQEIPPSPERTPAPAAPPAAVTSSSRPDRRPLAGRGERLGAALLDGAVYLVALASAVVLATALGYDLDLETSPIRIGLGSAMLPVAVVQMALLSLRGQTLGKMLMGVRVVDQDDGRNPGFVRAVLMRQVLPGMIVALPCLGRVFWLADCLCIFGEERRCFHDLIAGTKVVRTE
jgi:uncharacterized RDD family membrane protein YckC